MSDAALFSLATAAGIAPQWTDAFGAVQAVKPETLRALLHALQLACATEQQCRESIKHLKNQAQAAQALPPVLTSWAGAPALLPNGVLTEGSGYRIQLENGGALQGRLDVSAGGSLQTSPILEAGYHQFESSGLQTTLAVAPRSCFRVSDALQRQGRPTRERVWGLSAQIYSLRRAGDGGLANYSALQSLAEQAAKAGAAALAVSPVHAMFSADPTRFSPYGPSSRVFLNVLHIDPAQVLGQRALDGALDGMPGSRETMARLEALPQVDWPAASALRLGVLRKLFDRFRQASHCAAADSKAAWANAATGFKVFCDKGGQALLDHARFEALDAWLRRQQPEAPQGDWRRWSAAFQDPRGPEVTVFALAHADDVAFHQFLQYLASAGCQAVQAAARAAGMPIGVVADLAVGADPGGSQAWGLQSAMLAGVSIGAPPDLLSQQGQGWGLCAFSPLALQAQGFAPWLNMLRANMQHSGGIRIDHVLGLKRLWLVPDGLPASEGAYLHYPLDDLLRLTALESTRQGAIVIGEDLGTVPEGFSDQLASSGVLGIRVLPFQQEKSRFLQPGEWPAHAMATTSTHDLATVAGWWSGRDIDWRARLDLLGTEQPLAAHRQARELEKQALWQALQQAGAASGALPPPEAAPLGEVLRFTGSAPAALVVVPLEDVLGLVEQPNLPGTVHTHPNWQQRLALDVDALLQSPEAKQRLALLQQGRQSNAGAAASRSPWPQPLAQQPAAAHQKDAADLADPTDPADLTDDADQTDRTSA